MKLRPTALLLVALSAACASAPMQQQASVRQTVATMPSWFMNPPSDPNYSFGRGTATSPDLQTAMDNAVLSARNDLASQMTARIQSVTKRFTEQTGAGQDAQMLQQFENTIKAVVSEEIVGSRTKQQETVPDGAVYRVFVLVEMPFGKAAEALMNKVKANQAMYTRFRASQAFADLDAEVAKYEEAKKAGTP